MVRLDCQKARQQWLNRTRVERNRLSGDSERHLAGCPDCRRHKVDIDRMDEGLGSLKPYMPSGGFVTRVMRAIAQPAIRPVQTWDSKWNLTAAVAASILLLTATNYFSQGPGSLWVSSTATHGVSGAESIYANIKGLLDSLL